MKVSDTDLMKPDQVAALFRVNVKTVARWAKTGKLTPLHTPGGHRRYIRGEVTALLLGNPLTPAQVRALHRLIISGAT